MAAFQFRLQRVLEWYGTQLRLEENRFAACQAALNMIEERLARLRAERLSIERDVISGDSIRATDLAALGLYRVRANKEALALDDERARRQRTLRDQLAAVQVAQRRVRLVEKLREKRLSEHRAVEDRALENLAAEAYLSKWTAKQ